MPAVADAQILVAGEGPVVYGHTHLNREGFNMITDSVAANMKVTDKVDGCYVTGKIQAIV